MSKSCWRAWGRITVAWLAACAPTGSPSPDTTTTLVDEDGDGFDATVDCDDQNVAVNPEAEETCDGVDNDCDTLIDDDDDSLVIDRVWFADVDGDGFGDDEAAVRSCDAPPGHVADATDCDDLTASTHPGATELCNDVDDDCDPATAGGGVSWFDATTGTYADLTAAVSAGTSTAPWEHAPVGPGTLSFCPGTWYTRMFPQGDVEVRGLGRRESVVLDGAYVSTGFVTRDAIIEPADSSTVAVRSLTLQNRLNGIVGESADVTLDNVILQGIGEPGFDGNGFGISIEDGSLHIVDSLLRDSNPLIMLRAVRSDLTLERTVLQGLSSNLGLSVGDHLNAVSTTLSDLTVHDNAFSTEAAIVYGDSTCTRCVFRDNAESTGVLDVHVEAGQTATFEELEVVGNDTGFFAAMGVTGDGHVTLDRPLFDSNVLRDSTLLAPNAVLSLRGNTTTTCIGEPNGEAGFLRNDGRAVRVWEIYEYLTSGTRIERPMFDSRGCDFGEEGTADDNEPSDLVEVFWTESCTVCGFDVMEQEEFHYGNDETFCVGEPCP